MPKKDDFELPDESALREELKRIEREPVAVEPEHRVVKGKSRVDRRIPNEDDDRMVTLGHGSD